MDVRQTLDRMNAAWLEGRFDELSECVDENIVMKGPGLKEQVRGRSAFVQSYRAFMSSSQVVEYHESNHTVDEWPLTAVAAYNWSMVWTHNGKQESGSGQDLFLFERRGTDWIAVLRLMLF